MLRQRSDLGGGDINRLIVFVRDGLHDPRALRALIPPRVPSGYALPEFE